MRKYIVTVNGKKYEVEVEEVGAVYQPVEKVQEVRQVQPAVQQPVQEVKKETVATAPGSAKETVKAPMPGTILDVKVSQGQKVKKGDVLFILEAMKMENEIMSGVDGTVSSVAVTKGVSVNTDDLLAVIE
ncbi:carboxylesterase [Fervidicella metallireducens AeB]|uniref:Carboxylesterase n=1 Tax=Fervidicella metallireducens AeB TaxID=1403537 RepID=A0A017RT53_9CLOT|nr:biotin/lipoyl-containing protein [Fervidicella metallireducens]EYE87938.1 carboxylesterase [Fervidicella metallireducens AeB]